MTAVATFAGGLIVLLAAGDLVVRSTSALGDRSISRLDSAAFLGVLALASAAAPSARIHPR